MKWKKVSEHPLPDGDGKQLYLVEWVKRCDSASKLYAITQFPPLFNNSQSLTLRFCEFNPDEIESGDEKTFDVSEQFKNLDAPYLLNELHDEIESVDSLDVPSVLKGKSEYKSATEVMGEFRAKQEAAMNQALFAKRMIEEPSWEEKFRWETAAKMMMMSRGNDLNHLDWCVAKADELIAILKRGRE